MPKVIVYVPAAAWKKLEDRGLDPAKAVREFAKRGYEMTPPVYTDAAGKPFDPQPVRETLPDPHFKPDFK